MEPFIFTESKVDSPISFVYIFFDADYLWSVCCECFEFDFFSFLLLNQVFFSYLNCNFFPNCQCGIKNGKHCFFMSFIEFIYNFPHHLILISKYKKKKKIQFNRFDVNNGYDANIWFVNLRRNKNERLQRKNNVLKMPFSVSITWWQFWNFVYLNFKCPSFMFFFKKIHDFFSQKKT